MTNKKSSSINYLILILSLSGCGIFKNTTTLKTYKKLDKPIDCSVDTNNALCRQPFVTIEPFSSTEIDNEDKKSEKTLWDLSGQGQDALINRLSERNKDNDEFKKELENSYLKEPESSDFTTKKVKIILTIDKLQNNYTTFADRIQFLHFNLSLNGQAAEFKKWNKYETEFAEIELGEVSFEKKIEPKLSVGTDETFAKAEIGGGLTKTESQKLKNKIAVLNGKFSKDSLVVKETGAIGLDLNGNVIIEATIKFKDTIAYFAEFTNLRNSKGRFLPMDSVVISLKKIRVPKIAEGEPLKATLTYGYYYRHVTKNYNTIPEYDDRVTFIKGNGIRIDIDVLDADEIMPDRYLIYGDQEQGDCIGLEFCDGGPNSNCHNFALWFSDEEKAAEFYTWLRYWGKQRPMDTTPIKFNAGTKEISLTWIIETSKNEYTYFTFHTAHIFDFAEIKKP